QDAQENGGLQPLRELCEPLDVRKEYGHLPLFRGKVRAPVNDPLHETGRREARKGALEAFKLVAKPFHALLVAAALRPRPQEERKERHGDEKETGGRVSHCMSMARRTAVLLTAAAPMASR